MDLAMWFLVATYVSYGIAALFLTVFIGGYLVGVPDESDSSVKGTVKMFLSLAGWSFTSNLRSKKKWDRWKFWLLPVIFLPYGMWSFLPILVSRIAGYCYHRKMQPMAAQLPSYFE